ncbi:thiamine pyrophosphate-binding protein [Verrucosispora sp. NA02020]|uniref:thiamine pyrophosphate-binding protein n=1 Tax=Verrucosispora sp. NA02020 TaxID=2742132 RepID=UPI0015908B1F|nr:thiamine pyrophosphate-binding protein [Verrucosispora sp. NA02020]QKW13684.1 thiamine pyrophosphate-binding protein [Verrucosispora sp. NA02020]
MRVQEAIAASVHRLGVRHVFGLMGRGNMGFLLDMVHRHGIGYIGARHETNAVTMADAYARSTGRLGVATVSVGPAFSNALTGILESARGQTPLLLFAGDTATTHGDYGQFLDQAPLLDAVGVAHRRLDEPHRVGPEIAEAARRAVHDRRPVVLTVPLDVQRKPVEALVEPVGPPEPAPHPLPDAAALDTAVEAIRRSRRPVLVAGRGALAPPARAALIELAERAGAVLGTTLHADGLFAGEPWNVGLLGAHCTAYAADLMATADLILAFGTGLDRYTTRGGHLFPQVREIVHCELDPRRAASAPVTVRLTGDTTATARSLAAELRRGGHRATGFRTGPWDPPPPSPASATGTPAPGFVDLTDLLSTLDAWLPAHRSVVQESSHAAGNAVGHLRVAAPRARVSTFDFESIGLGLATAVGTAVGRPDAPTVAAVGDGGALMALGELETAVRHRLPILLLVLNDSAYGAEARELEMRGLPITDALFPTTDFAAVGRALGAAGTVVRDVSDLVAIRDWIARPEGPYVLDCRLDPTLVSGWFQLAIASPEGYLRRPRWQPC